MIRFIFDFDHTLIDVNSDPFVVGALNESIRAGMDHLPRELSWVKVMGQW